MEGTHGIPDTGIFPHNLIGRVMKRFVDEGWPYPQEVCEFWDEAIGLAQSLGGGKISQYDAEAQLLTAMGLAGSVYVPEQWHSELAYRNLKAEAAELLEQKKLQDKITLALMQPNPPRIAQFQVKHKRPDGGVSYYPLTFGPVLLKEDGNWKYHDTATIKSSEITEMIRELEGIQERIFLNDQASQTSGQPPSATPMMDGKSSPCGESSTGVVNAAPTVVRQGSIPASLG
jgi:hypothetical protein